MQSANNKMSPVSSQWFRKHIEISRIVYFKLPGTHVYLDFPFLATNENSSGIAKGGWYFRNIISSKVLFGQRRIGEIEESETP